MKIKIILMAAVFALIAAVLTGCGGSSDSGRNNNRYTGEYIYTSQDYCYREYLYVESNGDFGIGYYALGSDGNYYRTAELYGTVYNNGNFSNARKSYDDGAYVTGIYGTFSLQYSDELWINMTERDPYTYRTVTSDTQYYRERWRSNYSAPDGDFSLPEKIKGNGKTGKTCEKTKNDKE